MKITIDIEIVKIDNHGCHFLVEVLINEKITGKMIIDTGASQTIISKNIEALAAQILPIEYKEFKTLNHIKDSSKPEFFDDGEFEFDENGLFSMTAGQETIDFGFCKIPFFSVGGLKLKDFATGYIDLSKISRFYEKLGKKNVWGLLGSDFLNKYKASIDLKSKQLTLIQ